MRCLETLRPPDHFYLWSFFCIMLLKMLSAEQQTTLIYVCSLIGSLRGGALDGETGAKMNHGSSLLLFLINSGRCCLDVAVSKVDLCPSPSSASTSPVVIRGTVMLKNVGEKKLIYCPTQSSQGGLLETDVYQEEYYILAWRRAENPASHGHKMVRSYRT